MLGALALIWVGFHIMAAVHKAFGAFLTPRNLWNLSRSDLFHRDHGDRNGAGDRHPPHRPVGWLDPGVLRHRNGRVQVNILPQYPGSWAPDDVDHRVYRRPDLRHA